MTDVDTTQFDNKGSRITVKSMRAKLKINEVGVGDVGWEGKEFEFREKQW